MTRKEKRKESHPGKHPEMLQLLGQRGRRAREQAVEITSYAEDTTPTSQRRMAQDKVPLRTGVEVNRGHSHDALDMARALTLQMLNNVSHQKLPPVSVLVES